MKKRNVIIITMSITLCISFFLNMFVAFKNPHFAATEHFKEEEGTLKHTILFAGNEYINARDFLENEDEFWETYTIKGTDEKICDLDGGDSFWYGVFRNKGIFSFKEDPNRWAINCFLSSAPHDVYFRYDLELPTLRNSDINAIFVSDGVFHYEEEEYKLKIDDKGELNIFIDAYKKGVVHNWTKQLIEKYNIEGSYYIIVSYEKYPFYQKIIDFDTNQGMVSMKTMA